MKEELLSSVREHLAELSAFHKGIKASKSARISQRQQKMAGSSVSRRWFDQIRPMLEKASFPEIVISEFSHAFERLLLLVKGYTAKQIYLRELSSLIAAYKREILHQIEIGTFSTTPKLNIGPYLEGLPTKEGDYLDEAQRCLSVEGIRACIILGWCATVARIHERISELGFSVFTKATEQMATKTFGRFKAFNKRLTVENLSDLQRVFDTDILWVLEFLELIDSNQHQRLRHCFDLRNHSAHPGLAPITGENLYAFYSDISKIVLKNPKFTIPSASTNGQA